MTRTAWILALASTAATVAASAVSVQSGLVARNPRVLDDLPPYGDELRALPPYADYPSKDTETRQPYDGPGWYPRRSPDGRHVAATESWGGFIGEVVLGMVIERPFIHTVGVWDESGDRFVRVVSIKEADPHSGIAHRYAWSKDSKALLIYGSGRLPDAYEQIVKLCLVYVPEDDALYRLTACPALN
jgi:hypothetical protein